jgi:hypothetical protein
MPVRTVVARKAGHVPGFLSVCSRPASSSAASCCMSYLPASCAFVTTAFSPIASSESSSRKRATRSAARHPNPYRMRRNQFRRSGCASPNATSRSARTATPATCTSSARWHERIHRRRLPLRQRELDPQTLPNSIRQVARRRAAATLVRTSSVDRHPPV